MMTQKPATKHLFTAVPGYSRLYRRGATYYFRVGIPLELRKSIGKTEIIKSLRTTDFREAKRLVAFGSADADALFVAERRKLQPVAPLIKHIKTLSDAEIHQLVLQWFIGTEQQTLDWWEQSGQFMDETHIAETLDTLRIDEASFGGGTAPYEPADGSSDLNAFLAEHGIDCPKDSAAYEKLRKVFHLGRLENIRRTLDRIEGKPIQARERDAPCLLTGKSSNNSTRTAQEHVTLMQPSCNRSIESWMPPFAS
jgi:hypothetical protein